MPGDVIIVPYHTVLAWFNRVGWLGSVGLGTDGVNIALFIKPYRSEPCYWASVNRVLNGMTVPFDTLQGNVYVAKLFTGNHNVAVLLDYMVNRLYIVELAIE